MRRETRLVLPDWRARPYPYSEVRVSAGAQPAARVPAPLLDNREARRTPPAHWHASRQSISALAGHVLCRRWCVA